MLGEFLNLICGMHGYFWIWNTVEILDYDQKVPVKCIIGDIADKSSMREAFEGVNCVFHCAAYVSYEYPPNYSKLDEVNVGGTEYDFKN